MALEAGELVVNLEYGQGLKDKDWFGKQDPYCILTCGTQTLRSRTAVDGGKNPVWNATFRFNVINENDITFVLMDEDTLSRDDLIGKGRINLAKAREHGTDRQLAPVMGKHNKQRGVISLGLTFVRNRALRPAAAAHHACPAVHAVLTGAAVGGPASHSASPAYAVPYAAPPSAPAMVYYQPMQQPAGYVMQPMQPQPVLYAVPPLPHQHPMGAYAVPQPPHHQPVMCHQQAPAAAPYQGTPLFRAA